MGTKVLLSGISSTAQVMYQRAPTPTGPNQPTKEASWILKRGGRHRLSDNIIGSLRRISIVSAERNNFQRGRSTVLKSDQGIIEPYI